MGDGVNFRLRSISGSLLIVSPSFGRANVIYFPANQKMEIRTENWKGAVPIEVLPATTDVSSINDPPPYYSLIPRVGYLSAHIDKITSHFASFVVQGWTVENIWFSVGQQHMPLRWDMPIGVLFDLHCGLDP
jgi:hypothetical protein